ncbi:hypothetical protein PYCC9005_002418 [Savitreella phatthalungensis]
MPKLRSSSRRSADEHGGDYKLPLKRNRRHNLPRQRQASPSDIARIDQKLEQSAQKVDQPRRFLMKAEPETRMEKGHDVRFSIDDLKARGEHGEPWDGVRNSEACKIMRTEMQIGDLGFFYHSNCPTPGIAGILRIRRAGHVDDSAFDSQHPYYDPKSSTANPRWYRVEVEYVRHMQRFISLRELREHGAGMLKDMALLKRPQLSVQRVQPAEWDFIMSLEKNNPK